MERRISRANAKTVGKNPSPTVIPTKPEREERTTQEQQASLQFEIRHLDMSPLETGFRRGGDQPAQSVYRISKSNSISPAELARDTNNDEELIYVKSLNTNNLLSQLHEPNKLFQDTFSTK